MQIATHHSMINSHVSDAGRHHGAFASAADYMVGVARRWHERNLDLRSLDQLEERDLRDIGASRWEIRRELSRSVWRG